MSSGISESVVLLLLVHAFPAKKDKVRMRVYELFNKEIIAALSCVITDTWCARDISLYPALSR